MNKDDLTRVLISRAVKCVHLAKPHLDKGEYFIAGSCISTDDINDIDIYPAGDSEFVIPTINRIDTKSLNSMTIAVAGGPPLQFCRYKKPDLDTLISSFDFSHVQAGVHIRNKEVKSVAWTDSYLYAGASRTTDFEGSEYPLSSAIRLLKYHKRGEISQRGAMVAMLKIIEAIVARGFKDYNDFKDQLDAVDLGLVPKDIKEIGEDGLKELFERLVRGH